MGLELTQRDFYDNGGGLDLRSSPTKGADDDATLSLNMDYTTDGAFFTRNGSSIVNLSGGLPAQMSGAPRTLLFFNYVPSIGSSVQIICAGTTIKTNLSSPVDAVTGLSGSTPIPDMEFMVTSSEELAIWGNGTDVNLKFDGSVWTNLSFTRPVALSAADGGAGTLPAGNYSYYYAYARTIAGVIVQEGELSPVATVTLGASRQAALTGITVSPDSACNARVIYRISTTSGGIAFRLTTINDNVTTTYNDNTATDGTIAAQFDNQAAPTSKVFEEYLGKIYYVDAASSTDLYPSKANRPWNVPTNGLNIFDGPIRCLRKFFGLLIIGTDRSIWVLNGDIASNVPRRISSVVGILNNRCAVGDNVLYILATNYKAYALAPSDLTQTEIRLDKPISFRIDPGLDQIGQADTEKPCMEYYTKPNKAMVTLSVPTTVTNNDRIWIYNESQSQVKQKPCWYPWDNINVSALKQMLVNGVISLYSGDFNGFIWKLDDNSKKGDGAEVNGTVTSSTASTLVDNTQTWTVNAYVGMIVRIISGKGVDQFRTVISNTGTTLTISSGSTDWATNPDATSTYTLGGYDAYHNSNWKFLTGSYDTLKQLWFLRFNANASGNYTIELNLQFDFDTNISTQTNLLISLQSGNTIWGAFLWGGAVWGSRSVFQDQIRQFSRFRAVRFQFRNRKAGQPFQINGFSTSSQEKGYLYPAVA